MSPVSEEEDEEMGVIRKRGKNYIIDFYHKGRRIRKTVGRSKKIAELALANAEVKSARGEHLGIYEDKKILFEDLAKEYLTFSKASKAYSSYERDTRSLNVHLIPYFEGMYVFEVTSHAIEKYKVARREKVGRATVNRELACLRHMLRKAVEWEYIAETPMKTVRLLSEPPGRLRFLSEEEWSVLLANCAPHVRPIVVTAFHSGMRKSEILNLKRKDVDFREKTITVRNSKNNESRILSMNKDLYDELNSIPRHFMSEFMFCDKDGKPYSKIHKGFRAAVKRAGIENFRFHDLRHTCAAQLVMAGVDLRTVGYILGHKTLRMTMRYSHLSQAHVRKAFDTLAGFGHNMVTSGKTADNADAGSS